ncbi:LysM peptidoglycan-binding domain-containing protein [Paenibacillus sp. P96]|uniref:LysM peptidoglycan-binding domain-containing protein n=1 Tax=Paenibacillus zeirhizosphaerae TaxID=2987519 RepID=A0ABT9FW97_9BACL|nr:LysM peptidoglycan-binding domain-containing protein [Paenibacillus sp. P96]MDP4098987.1 LysM peptidoglycan-binding domain-containing protein [Paenibacillus sp. P96]
MDFILKDGQGVSFKFPVNPEEVSISRQKGYDTVNILNYGEFDFPQGEKVKEITFSSFFPQEYDPSYCNCEENELPDPMAAMNTLNAFLMSQKPLRFIMTETAINVPVFVASHNSTFRGNEQGDVSFDISLRTWRDMKIAQKAGVSGKQTAVNKKQRSDLKEQKKSYTVKSGDSLSKIAKLELGDSSKWQSIYTLNKKIIGTNPNAIKPGQKLVLP